MVNKIAKITKDALTQLHEVWTNLCATQEKEKKFEGKRLKQFRDENARCWQHIIKSFEVVEKEDTPVNENEKKNNDDSSI